MPTPACEDADTIARRIAELRKELADNLNCKCRLPDGGGDIDRSACEVHRGPVPVDLLCGLRDPRDCWGRVVPWRILP